MRMTDLLSALAFCAMASVFILGCHDSSTGDNPAPGAAPSSGPFAGSYATTINHNTQNNLIGGEKTAPLCGDDPCEETLTLDITGNGNDISIGGTLSGCDGSGSTPLVAVNLVVKGNVVRFEYSFPDGDGTTTSEVTLTFVSVDEDDDFETFEGQAEYLFSDGKFECGGFDDWSGVRQGKAVDADLVVCSQPGLDIVGGDKDGVQDTINIQPGSGGAIVDLNVQVDISYSFVGDLHVEVVSPSDTSVILYAGDKDDGEDMRVTFDDEGATGFPMDCQCNQQPFESLSVVDGEQTSGTWLLHVRGSVSEESGTLNEWCLQIDAADPPKKPSGDLCSSPELAIPDGDEEGVTDTITVPEGGDEIDDLNVFVDITHAFVGDLDVELTSPAETTVVLVDGLALKTFADGSDIGAVFDDNGEGFDSVPLDCDCFVRPFQELATFGGELPDGDWTLLVRDNSEKKEDEGVLNEWCLDINGGVGKSGEVCNEPDAAIPDADKNGVTDTIAVDNGFGTIGDLDVLVDVTHAFVGGLDVEITSPDETTVALFIGDNTPENQEGENIAAIFDDEGNEYDSLPFDCECDIAPHDSLSEFDGDDSNGDWLLRVRDNDKEPDEGVLNAWCLHFNSDEDE